MTIEWEDIIDTVQLDQVLDNLGVNVTSIVRGEHWASCQLPSHPSADTKPSFSINEDTLLWNCFTCNEGGLLPSLVYKLLEFEDDKPEGGESPWEKAIDWLLPYADVDVHSDEGFQTQLDRYLERTRAKKKHVRWEPLPYFSPTALDKYDLCPVELLEKWHIIVPQVVEKYGIRYDEDHRRKETDYSGPCIIIPHWFEGELVGFMERWLDEDRPKWLPKYTNSDNFPKKQTLFNYDRAVEAAKEGEPVTVVEAAMTTVRLDQLDFVAVGTFGASITPEQFNLLSSLYTVIFASDGDATGTKAFKAAVQELIYKVNLYKLPPNPVTKGDLADLDDDQVFEMYDSLSWAADA